MTNHYPGHLLKDYEILLQYFPSHAVCRPYVVEAIVQWKKEYTEDTPVEILEIGPGYGDTTELILDSVPTYMALVEADPDTCTLLEHKFKKYSDQITIIEGDAIEWIKVQPDESYDAFTASWVVHNFPKEQREEFLKEIHRILRPGGLCIMFEKVVPDDAQERERLWQIGMKRLEGLDTIGRPDLRQDMVDHEIRDNNEPFVWHEKELLETMEKFDFQQNKIIMRNERDIVFSSIRK